MRKIEKIICIICLAAAVLCVCGSDYSSIAFCVSSLLGFIDSKKGKAKSGMVINTIFFVMNFIFLVKGILL